MKTIAAIALTAGIAAFQATSVVGQTTDVIIGAGLVAPVQTIDAQGIGWGLVVGVGRTINSRWAASVTISNDRLTGQCPAPTTLPNCTQETGGRLFPLNAYGEAFWALLAELQWSPSENAHSFQPYLVGGVGYFLQSSANNSMGMAIGFGVRHGNLFLDAKLVHPLAERNFSGGQTTYLPIRIGLLL